MYMTKSKQKVWDEPTKMQYAHNNNSERNAFQLRQNYSNKKCEKSSTHAHTHGRIIKKKINPFAGAATN